MVDILSTLKLGITFFINPPDTMSVWITFSWMWINRGENIWICQNVSRALEWG